MSRYGQKILLVLSTLLFFLGVFLIVVYLWMVKRFDNATFDMIVIYLKLPMTGVDMTYVTSGIAQVVFVLMISGMYGYGLRKTLSVEKIGGVGVKFIRLFALLFSGCLFAYGLNLLEEKYELRENLFPDHAYNTYFEDRIAITSAEDVSFPGGKNNLVLVILESVERTYNNPELFDPILMPRLKELGERGVSFTGYRQCVGTEYSIASFYSMMLGVPFLSVLLEKHDAALTDEEVEGALQSAASNAKDFHDISLPGVLEKHGYEVSLFRCADARFGGYNDLIARTTENGHIFDFDYFDRTRDDVNGKQNHWGLFDSFIYERAKEYMTATHEDGPFFLMIQTVDTHSPGHFEKGLPRPNGDFRDSFYQADILVSEFQRWIENQPFGERTTVVVVGDHLLGVSDVGPVSMPPHSMRSIQFIIDNPLPGTPKGDPGRIFAAWDLPATLLEAVGARLPEHRFALGTSLFSDQDTLLAKDGVARYDRMIKRRSRLYESRYRW